MPHTALFTNDGNASTLWPTAHRSLTEAPTALPQVWGNLREGKRLLTAKVCLKHLVELCRLFDERHVDGIPNDDFPVTAARGGVFPQHGPRLS
jgi:hypothetical protein